MFGFAKASVIGWLVLNGFYFWGLCRYYLFWEGLGVLGQGLSLFAWFILEI